MPDRPTTVISVRSIYGPARAALIADPDFVYVGRGFAGWAASPFGNSFKVGNSYWFGASESSAEFSRSILTTGQAVELYRAWLLGEIPGQPDTSDLRARLPELRGRRLGCWCSAWSPGDPPIACHAYVLAKLADATEADHA